MLLVSKFLSHPCKPHQSQSEKEHCGGFGDGIRQGCDDIDITCLLRNRWPSNRFSIVVSYSLPGKIGMVVRRVIVF